MGDLIVMDKINAATLVIIIGAGLLLISLLADVIGIGDDVGFGRQQTMGTVAGLIILAVGVYLNRKQDKSPPIE
jgi:uncharacterized membrane protein YdcZ (DUF606 family)